MRVSGEYMSDWEAIARARGITASGKELEALLAPLQTLETVFRPAVRDLPFDLNPAVVFCPGTAE